MQTTDCRLTSGRYTESIQTGESNQGLYKIYGNRSLAYSRAQRYDEALYDAQKTIELAPSWPKGYWRLGTAFLGLKQTTQAIEAFAKCWHLDHGMKVGQHDVLLRRHECAFEQSTNCTQVCVSGTCWSCSVPLLMSRLQLFQCLMKDCSR